MGAGTAQDRCVLGERIPVLEGPMVALGVLPDCDLGVLSWPISSRSCSMRSSDAANCPRAPMEPFVGLCASSCRSRASPKLCKATPGPAAGGAGAASAGAGAGAGAGGGAGQGGRRLTDAGAVAGHGIEGPVMRKELWLGWLRGGGDRSMRRISSEGGMMTSILGHPAALPGGCRMMIEVWDAEAGGTGGDPMDLWVAAHWFQPAQGSGAAGTGG
mmetsp:Transcript_22082/g.51499  ORF Transcript_22082/g.51499 Transcript_22082/m.51499 type:complete len:215 (+) Transcript_22082:1086-1730(+)